MRFIVISDIHGCFDELKQLLDLVSPTDSDQIISIGDIIHKGPNESSCLDLVMSISDWYILGNHEEKQLRWERHESRRVETGKSNPMKHVEDYKSIAAITQQKMKDRAKLFYQLEVKGEKYILIHGGIEPRVRSLPKTDMAYQISRKEKGYAWNLLRTRFVNSKGGMVALGDETDEDVYWAEIYDGRFGHAIFGHQPFFDEAPHEFPFATAIDLGCVYGGYLCALIIDGETGERTHVKVKAHQKYQKHRSEKVDGQLGLPMT